MIAACEPHEPATRAVVELTSDLGRQLSTLQIIIRDARDRESGAPHTISVAGGLPSPFSFAVAPNAENDSSCIVIVEGVDAKGEFIAQAKALVSFAAERVVTVRLSLLRACNERCGPVKGCGASGMCVPLASPARSFAGDSAPVAEAGNGSMDVLGPAGTAAAGARAAAGAGGKAGSAAAGGGASGASTGEPGIGPSGAVCSVDGETRCAEHAGGQRVVCWGGRWSSNGGCAGNTLCDPASSPRGSCATVPVPCRGKLPLDHVCDGAIRKRCDADLLRFLDAECPPHAHCDPKQPAKCACDESFQEDGKGGCELRP
ncbi:MAG TPA: hypothetical protein VJV78_33870 [Polyangiales bacterium]|nr:hypothetical protein [Polyangiales bacterium]